MTDTLFIVLLITTVAINAAICAIELRRIYGAKREGSPNDGTEVFGIPIRRSGRDYILYTDKEGYIAWLSAEAGEAEGSGSYAGERKGGGR